MAAATHAFQTEVQQLLHLMIHSLYSEREIFLRELISNASDACDKLRFQALTDKDLMAGDDDLAVRIRADAEAGTLVIEDNGIGMGEDDAVENLGTIARSGTKDFAEKIAGASPEEAKALIGQFGVGFYSAFMVADRIVVETRRADLGSDDGVRWESTGDGTFEVERVARPQRGTAITLHLKDDAKEFADPQRVRGLIKRYSDYLGYPIRMPKADDDEWEQVNESQALWTRPKSEISDEQYAAFYKAACHQWDEPATRIHFSVEGTLSFTALLFVPSTRPFDLFDRNRRGLSLYVRRVFIMDDCEDLLPEYLRFVRGVVDSDDLPLNVSREILQQETTVARLRKQLTKRVLDHLEKLAASGGDEERATFTTIDRQFGAVLREGLVADHDNRERIAKLVRYQSTWTLERDAEEKPEHPTRTGLADYVTRMEDGQDKIYYLTAPSLEAARTSPHVEGYRERGYEVLFMTDPIDEYVMQYASLDEFEGKRLVHVAKGADDLDDEEAKKALEEAEKEYADFLGFAGERLGGQIKEVRLSNRLTDSPCCLVAEEHGMSKNMEELMRGMGQEVPPQQRILELNPDHALVQRLRDLHAEAGRGDEIGEHLAVLKDQAVLAEGGRIDDPAGFASRVQKLMSSALGGKADAEGTGKKGGKGKKK